MFFEQRKNWKQNLESKKYNKNSQGIIPLDIQLDVDVRGKHWVAILYFSSCMWEEKHGATTQCFFFNTH
jgi:hypothetical protein